MKKKEYIKKLINLISNKLKYNAPLLKVNKIDYNLLDAVGIDVKYPVFIYERPLDRTVYRAFLEVKKNIKFNLILRNKPTISLKKIEKMELTFLIFNNDLGDNFNRNLEALNINYVTHSDYKNNLVGEYVLIKDRVLDFDYTPYYFYKKISIDGVIYDMRKFILNGKNFLIKFINTKKIFNTLFFELNIPLPRGYYSFHEEKNCILIENLTTKEKIYFNFICKNINFSFSNINGVENSTFPCIHLKINMDIPPMKIVYCFFSLSKDKFLLNNLKKIENFFNISQLKMNEIFDLKVISKNKAFDDMFNRYLPYNIWRKWQNFSVDEKSENEWLKLRNLLVKNTNKGEQINREFIDIKMLKFFRFNRWKSVFIVHNNSNYLYADNVKYFNYDLLTKDIFSKNNEIYLSFDK